MNKRKVNGILARLARVRRELYATAAEFGDVDNYFMTEIEDISNRIGRVNEEIKTWKSDRPGEL